MSKEEAQTLLSLEALKALLPEHPGALDYARKPLEGCVADLQEHDAALAMQALEALKQAAHKTQALKQAAAGQDFSSWSRTGSSARALGANEDGQLAATRDDDLRFALHALLQLQAAKHAG